MSYVFIFSHNLEVCYPVHHDTVVLVAHIELVFCGFLCPILPLSTVPNCAVKCALFVRKWERHHQPCVVQYCAEAVDWRAYVIISFLSLLSLK